MKAPNLKILADESYASAGYHGAMFGLSTYNADVNETNELYLEFGFKTGVRRVLQTNCPIINEPDMSEGGEPCDYAWKLDPDVDGVFNPLLDEHEYPSMLEVVVFQGGTIIKRIEKKAYQFSVDCRADHPDCSQCINGLDPKLMVLPAFGIDLYYLYTDITDLIPVTGSVLIVICPKINWAGKWAEQNLNDNDLQLPVRIFADGTAVFDNAALGELTPIAPSNISNLWHAKHCSVRWNGNAEWYEVSKDGVITRLANPLFDDFNATGKSQLYHVRSGNRYRTSPWVDYTATKKQ